jgi:hypothetical protein
MRIDPAARTCARMYARGGVAFASLDLIAENGERRGSGPIAAYH